MKAPEVGNGQGVRSRLSREARMEQTLSVAHDLFAERGYNEVTMDEVAAEVGVTKPLLYNYFGNKEKLFLACLDQAAGLLEETVLEAVAGTDSPDQALREGLRAFFNFVAADHKTWRVLFDEAVPAESEIGRALAGHRNRILNFVATAIRAQFPADAPPQVEIEIEALSAAILGAAESLAHWWLRNEAIEPEQAAELLISTLEPGLRARTGPVLPAGEGTDNELQASTERTAN
jgi:AcrR family transcriptional regulator